MTAWQDKQDGDGYSYQQWSDSWRAGDKEEDGTSISVKSHRELSHTTSTWVVLITMINSVGTTMFV